MLNNFVRGAVSGLGVVNVLAALVELADAFGRERPAPLPEEGHTGDGHAP
jgi:hypothetical protein